jgi:hypothetical protein
VVFEVPTSLPGDFHKVSNEGVSKTMARPAVRLPIIELGQTNSSEAGSSYGVIERRHCRASEHKGVAAEVRVSTDRFRLGAAVQLSTTKVKKLHNRSRSQPRNLLQS